MSRFNLIDENWIPVRFPDGSRVELGILETLLRSKEIAAIEDQSPLVVAALHRFMLAVIYRALAGPTDIEQAKSLFDEGLPGDKITAYLKKWHDRFWLFDEKYPFAQNPNVHENQIEPWTKLTAEYNATSNKVLFDHTDAKNPGQKEPKECARWLLSTMTFSISGGRGYYPSPSSNAMMCIPLGQNLHQTLCLNLVPYQNKAVMSGDSALWEREPDNLPLTAPQRDATGYADMYTWPSREIFLKESSSGSVSWVRFIAGQGFGKSSNISDPMQPHRIDKTKGKLPVQFRESRGIWRDFDSLLPHNNDKNNLPPPTIENAFKLTNGPESILVLGLRYTPPNANLDFWRMERFVLPAALAGDRCVRTEIRQLLDEADAVQKSLWMSCSTFARSLLSRGDRKMDNKDVKAFIGQMPAISQYWSTLETRFHEILREYTLDRDPDDIRCLWLKYVKDALSEAWNRHSASVSCGDSWAIRALVKAEGPVMKKLKELKNEIEKLEPKKEKS